MYLLISWRIRIVFKARHYMVILSLAQCPEEDLICLIFQCIVFIPLLIIIIVIRDYVRFEFSWWWRWWCTGDQSSSPENDSMLLRNIGIKSYKKSAYMFLNQKWYCKTLNTILCTLRKWDFIVFFFTKFLPYTTKIISHVTFNKFIS